MASGAEELTDTAGPSSAGEGMLADFDGEGREAEFLVVETRGGREEGRGVGEEDVVGFSRLTGSGRGSMAGSGLGAGAGASVEIGVDAARAEAWRFGFGVAAVAVTASSLVSVGMGEGVASLRFFLERALATGLGVGSGVGVGVALFLKIRWSKFGLAGALVDFSTGSARGITVGCGVGASFSAINAPPFMRHSTVAKRIFGL